MMRFVYIERVIGMAGLSANVLVHLREEDVNEEDAITEFISKTCDCQHGPNKIPCSGNFSRDFLEEQRNSCHGLTSEQLDSYFILFSLTIACMINISVLFLMVLYTIKVDLCVLTMTYL